MSHMLIIAKADIYEGSMKDIFGFQMNAISETEDEIFTCSGGYQ